VPNDDLDKALRAYRAAQEAVPAAQERARAVVADARAKVDRTRERLAVAIVDAYDNGDGARVKDLAARTGYTRESVRRILRAAGVEAPARD
jgi:hypothetical protein